MSNYIKQSFKVGEILKAAKLNAMDEQIAVLSEQIHDDCLTANELKTINGQSLVGSGDIAISASGGGTITGVSVNGTSVATSGVANIPAASASVYGVTKLSSATDSTSTTLAATASAVKAAYDLANSKTDNIGTVTGVKLNGTTYSPTGGVVDLGTINGGATNEELSNYATKDEVNAKYAKPTGGIPKSDLASNVQTSLGKADTALQSYTEQYKGTVTGVKVNGTTKNPSNGVVDLGTVITSHQDISGKQDKLVSGTNIKTINGTSILGSGDITIEGGSNENGPLKFVFDENTYQYSIISTNDFGEMTWNLPSSGGNLVKISDVMYKLEYHVVGYLPEIYACAKGETDSTFFEKGAINDEESLATVSTDTAYVAGIVSGPAYNDDDTITFSIYTYDGKCIVITTSYSDEYIYTDEIRIIDFANLGGGSSGANVQTVDTGDVVDDVNVSYATTAYVDGLIGDINSVLESIISGGGNTANIISFTIEDVEYQAEEGMTWADWVNSSYNTGQFVLGGPYGEEYIYDTERLPIDCDTGLILSSSVIEPNFEYTIMD